VNAAETETVRRNQCYEPPIRDPINEELHTYRQQHARKFNFDLIAICKDLRERSRNLNVVRLRSNRIGPKMEKGGALSMSAALLDEVDGFA
jgi:hypothetical protein